MTTHGPLTEIATWRAHCSPVTQRVFLFRNADLRTLLDARLYQGRPFQRKQIFLSLRGHRTQTAEGWLVPWRLVPGIQAFPLPPLWWHKFQIGASTSAKGARAVEVFEAAVHCGCIPPLRGQIMRAATVDEQKAGADLWCDAGYVEVKCDWLAGDREDGGSGNLFIQEREINPLRQH